MTITFHPRGPFSPAAAARFVEGFPGAARDLEQRLCLDVDAAGFAALGRHDRVVGALQRRFPGLRPFLFYTPYEAAACRAATGAGRPLRQLISELRA